ncbi:MAG: amino acid adenylation domain-containing protein, partial [Candidatus Eremiobacteraeota bacterium]|nr:amino acid adenylation domain-containing protein [Candidatus Eremiobacteraeota bacterium]
NVAVRWRLDGDVSVADLERAWNMLLAPHDALRTSFEMTDGDVVQIVHPHLSLSIPTIDLRELSESAADAEAERRSEAEARVPFDLGRPPLLRVTALRLRERVTMLLVTVHHTICDGWSVGILAREMGELCAAGASGRIATLPLLPTSYGAYSIAQRDALDAANLEREDALLGRMLAGYKQFELLPDRRRPAEQTSSGNIASILLERDVSSGLTAVARKNGCTLFMTALASLFTLLHRYSGEDDITLATQVVGRDEVEWENVVGCFINTVALRADLSGDPTFAELLERTRDAVMDSFEVRHVPLERLVTLVNPQRDASRNALFSTNFIFQRSFIENERYGSFGLVDLPSRSAGALYDLNFFMVERPEGWRASCEYNTDLFDHGTIVALLERFRTLLVGIVAEPTAKIADLPLLSESERHRLVVDSNATAAPYPASKTLPQLFELQVARTPDAVALVCSGEQMTYAQLDAASNRLARELRARGLAPGTRIGVVLDRSPDLVIALLAVLKAGSAYIPLDPAYPADRLAFIAQESELAAAITRAPLGDRLGQTSVPLVLVDRDAASIAARRAESLDAPPAPSDPAYVIYTSGSTGRPKGVVIPHRALTNFLWSMRLRPGLGAQDTLVAVTTVSFDIAALELYLPLVVGAKLVVASSEEAADGSALLDLLRRSGATVLQATPITWRFLLDAGWRGTPSLKMLCGGEALSRELAARLLQCGDDLWNMYGPTETTIWSSVLRLEPGDGPVPIGPPIANTQFYILDAHGQLSPPGTPGELYIGGDGVALGYHGRPEQTRERFVPDPFRNVPGAKLYRTGDLVRARDHGRLEFLGRTDRQIKLNGFRIELEEIEGVLLRRPHVAEAVAIVGRDASGEPALRAYAVPADTFSGDAAEWSATLRSQLAAFVPAYMVPTNIVVLPSLPRTPNGKVDRNALPDPQPVPVEASRPGESSTETALGSLVAELLERAGTPSDVDIFAAGFHSLLALKLIARIAEAFGVDVPLRALFHHRTIAALAVLIDRAVETSSAEVECETIVTLNENGTMVPFIALHHDLFIDGIYCRKLAAAVGSSQPIHAVAPFAPVERPVVTTIEDMAREYLPRILAVQAQGPYRIGGFCMSGLIAYEVGG